MTKSETNILKGFGIILMFFHHLFYLQENYISYNIDFGGLSESITIVIAQMCRVCVAVFVFATAYGTTKNLNIKYSNTADIKYSEYCIERYFKLMFGFWFVWIIAQLTSWIGDRYTIYGEDLTLRIKYMIIDFFGSANALGTPSLNATWWYMSFAILLIFIMPAIYLVVKKIGLASTIIALFLPVYMGINMGSSINYYMFTIVLGILFAENDIFEKLKNKIKLTAPRIMGYSIILISVLVLILYMRFKAVSFVLEPFYDGLFTLALCVLSIVIFYIPFMGKFFEILGIHSMNMFLTHTFIKAYYFQDFTYQWKYPWLILLILLVDSLLLSVAIEWIKKKIKYDKLTQYAIDKNIKLVKKIRG